jgi:hypothetical protein
VQDTVDALRAILAARDRVRRRFTDIDFGDTPESIADQQG